MISAGRLFVIMVVSMIAHQAVFALPIFPPHSAPIPGKCGVFGPEFDPDSVEFTPWGTLELDLNCESGSATYDSTEDGFGSGILSVVRLTSIDQLDCTP